MPKEDVGERLCEGFKERVRTMQQRARRKGEVRVVELPIKPQQSPDRFVYPRTGKERE